MQKSEKKVSIIICAYNGAKYMRRCMESIQRQTIGIKNLEVILVNDGSTDETLIKMKEWEERYPENIMVITYDENRGPGGARNIGLEYATGEFVAYADCDDVLEPDMYEMMYEKAIEHQCNVVRCKLSRHKGTQEKQDRDKRTKGTDKLYDSSKMPGKYPFFLTDLDVGTNGYYGSICTGIYKREMLIENKVCFPEKLRYEDNFWGVLVSLYIEKLYIIDEPLYHYYINENSTTMKRNAPHHLDRMVIELMLLDEYKKRGVYEGNEKLIEKNFMICFYILTVQVLFARFDTIPDIFPKMREIILHNFPNYKKNELLYGNPLWEKLLDLLDFEPPCTVEELEVVREKYLQMYEM